LRLPAYDIRLRQELAQRRLLRALGRRASGILFLHGLDVAAVVAAVFTAAVVAPPPPPHIADVLIQASGLTLLALHATMAYREPHGRRDVWRIAAAVVVAVIVAVVALAVVDTLPRHANLPPHFLIAFAPVAAIALFAGRCFFRLLLRQAHRHGLGLRKAVVVGLWSDVRTVMRTLERDEQADHQILGCVTPNHGRDAKSLGSIDDLEAILDRLDPEELILSSALDPVLMRRVANACVKRGVVMLAVPSWERAIPAWAEPVRIGPLPGYHLHPTRLGMPALMLKRATDLMLTVSGLVVAAPIVAVVAAAIKLDSPGPVFYRQKRVGLGGREFLMWKFRSMRHEAESGVDEIAHLSPYQDGRLFKIRRDPRITRVGHLLRRFSLDELPQLVNVLVGDMSLVGPRPPIPSEVRRYEPHHFVRLTVVPGLTGPWQVNGRNLITDFEEVVRLERGYVEAWSLSTDIKIMARTIGVVLSGKGAY
jgi:exopolysaccharide biosynthesis polyprenyl glycosylphosphotransferase